jgi:ketosteroid isomerase-like protein
MPGVSTKRTVRSPSGTDTSNAYVVVVGVREGAASEGSVYTALADFCAIEFTSALLPTWRDCVSLEAL